VDLQLLPRTVVRPTSSIDHPQWNFQPLLAAVQRLRFRMALRLLGDQRYGRLLEIGYGSGIFLPALARRCDDLHGIDPHPMDGQVREALEACGVPAALAHGRVEDLPYESGFFNAAVAVSTLEYVTEIDVACREIRRVLAPGGALIVITPGATPLWNIALRLATREGPAQYGDRREKLQPALRRHFRLARQVQAPPLGGNLVRLYTGLRLHAD
jgi:SAM-dependent methyltransferase